MRSGVLLGLCVLAGCGNMIGLGNRGVKGDKNSPWITPEPEKLGFPALTSRDHIKKTVTLYNDGGAMLSIQSIALDAQTQSYAIEPAKPLPTTLDAGLSMTVDVTFQPVVGGPLPANLVIQSDASNEPTLHVPLTGTGQMPHAVLDPDPLDLGKVFIHCPKSTFVTLSNDGPEPLVVQGVDLSGSGLGVTSFGPNMPGAFTLYQHDTQFIPLNIDPSHPERIELSLALQSNDPRPEVTSRITGETGFVRMQTDKFDVPERLQVDLVFGVDQSGSMASARSTLATQFSSFIGQLEAATLNWRIGVVSRVISGKAPGCFDDIIYDSTPNPQAAFTAAINHPSTPDNDILTESLLGAVELAFNETAAGHCNEAFGAGRPGAEPLHIILISNEFDQSHTSGIANYLGWSPSNTPATRAKTFVQHYRDFAGQAAELKVHAIVDLAPNATASLCGGVQQGSWGYAEASRATQGYLLDLCNTNATNGWPSMISDIAQDVISGALALPLSSKDVWEPSITVTSKGQTIATGWYYDADRGAVVFDDPSMVRGKSLEITYGIPQTHCP